MRQRRWLGAAVAAAFTLSAAGCGDDDGGQLTTEEFFVALEVLGDDYDATSEDLEASFEESMVTATSAEDTIAAFVSFTEDGSGALEGFVDGIAELNAPSELTEFQDRAVSAGRAAIDSLNDMTTALSEVSSEDEFEAVLAGGDTQEVFDRFNDICYEAQSLADDAGVVVDYECEEE